MTSAREPRWIVLAQDGRHVTIGRHTDPAEAEIEASGEQLRSLGLGGWLVVMNGAYHQDRGPVTLMMVREIAPSAVAWIDAEAAFHRIQQETTFERSA